MIEGILIEMFGGKIIDIVVVVLIKFVVEIVIIEGSILDIIEVDIKK